MSNAPAPGGKNTADAYLPQLDGIRAIAVGLVLVQHWVTNSLAIPAPFGFVGVTMFFVLSGYLITRILIAAKNKRDAGKTTFLRAMRVFYARRFLRIFPIYYLTIAVLLVAGDENTRDSLGWLLTYTTNFEFLLTGHERYTTGHFWSLAIEEQYYLLYPAAVLLASLRGRLRGLVAMIAVAFMSRVALDLAGVSVSDNKYFTLSCFDSFALGGVLAHLEAEHGSERTLAIFRRPATGVVVGLVTFAFLAFGALLGDAASWRVVWFRFIVSIASLYLIGVALLDLKNNLFSRFLANGAVRYVGKISYGVYLYHVYAGYILATFLPIREYPLAIRIVLYSVVTLAVSTLSWILVEKPINSLKHRFNY